jgi:cholesterol transport system auxiliary component
MNHIQERFGLRYSNASTDLFPLEKRQQARPGNLSKALMLLAVLLITACGAPEPAQQDRFFSLQPQVQTPLAPPVTLGANLLVNDLAARGFLGGRQIVFRASEQPLEVQRYNLLLWEEPPGRAIARSIALSLRATGLFDFVITPAQRSRADFLLSGEIDRFEHRPTARPPKVVAEYSLTLLRGSDRRSLFSQRYQGQEKIRGETPQEMVEAFNRLAGRLITQSIQDLTTKRQSLGRAQ